MLISKIIHFGQVPDPDVTMSYKFSLICLKCSLLGLFLLFLQPATAQEDWSELEAQFKGRQKALGNEVLIIVWKNDTVAFKKELGQFNSKTQAPIGDASKWLTAAMVMILVDEGKISLDDKVASYIPEYARYGRTYITIRQCLSDMTGIEEEAKGFKKAFQRKKYSSLEVEVDTYPAHELRNNPNKDFWYGNLGMNTAGRVLEIVTKKKFDALIKQRLFTPMGMRRTSFSTLDNSSVNPTGGAITTADDYMQFLVMLLNKGKYKGKQILSEESVDELMRIYTKPEQIRFSPKQTQGLNYALGAWAVEEKDGKATALACPGLSGTFAIIDYCRKYAFLVLPKEPVDEEKIGAYMALKKEVDAVSNATCP
jgi:CubicO group peptidase (beta-lactamase class C family)